MGVKYDEVLVKLQEMMARLNYELGDGALIVVEGKRDSEVLRMLGLKGEPFVLCQSTVERLIMKCKGHTKVILMLDTDREGGRIAKRVSKALEKYVRVDDYSRRILRLTKGQVRHVEELKAFRSQR